MYGENTCLVSLSPKGNYIMTLNNQYLVVGEAQDILEVLARLNRDDPIDTLKPNTTAAMMARLTGGKVFGSQ